jgi:primosomal protein N' (replication factor Y)
MTQFLAGDRIAVLLPVALPGPLDYLVARGQILKLGQFVRVPLGVRTEIGVVWGAGTAALEESKMRPVKESLPHPSLPEISRRFVEWVAGYCLAPPGMVLKMAMSVPGALLPAKPAAILLKAADPLPAFPMTDARQRALAAAITPMSAADLAKIAQVGGSVIKSLRDLGALVEADAAPAEEGTPLPQFNGADLSLVQQEAADRLCAQSGFHVTLLEGVTGSGKTEVYFEAIAKTIAAGKQALVLLPEIALSAQWLQRFQQRFGATPVLWHSEVGDAQRRRQWRAVADGSAPVVVGARSALFLPFPDLGLIIVDEEHDPSFKQEDGVCYHARDMAVVRAQLGKLPIILATATPSLETQTNVAAGRYDKVTLPSRHGGAVMPEVELIDLRYAPPPKQHWISPPLVGAIVQAMAAGEQALLFLNRRGYAPLTLCGACGYRLQCPHCTAWLVAHRRHGKLQCHHCGHLCTQPETCPQCQAEDRFTPCGPGVERVAEEAAELFPNARIAIMTSDHLNGPAQARALVERMTHREIDLLIGTQIVAKGYHFPHLTVVGVIDADLGLAGGDLRAAERTFQLLSQVSGRAGRGEKPGRVYLQSYSPDAPVLQALARGDAEGFAKAETRERKSGHWPPFGRLAALIISAPDADEADKAALALARVAPRDDALELLGPAPAPLALLRGRHRRRMLLKAPKTYNLGAVVRQWLAKVTLPKQVRVQVDIDPYSFL